jgi:serine/threonine protein kinase/Leucine-rich repeat (LRR) protein
METMSVSDQPADEEAIFQNAAALPPAERSAYLQSACDGRPELRAGIEQLLASIEDDAFMEKPVDRTVSPELAAEFARLKPEEAGDVIGQYKLLQQIGEGGFGVVWMAEQEKPMRRRVALKIIKLGMDTKEVIARFEQERQALAMMEHPNIARVLDAGATPFGRPYFVMELVRGIRITDYCDQANLSTAERLQIFVAVCGAVQHAHQKGIIHRDLKPSNILVTMHDGVPTPKVIDFGVAKATQQQRLTDLTLFTQFEQMVGTPLYMSPEQAEMSSLDIDTRSDIYSLGVLLYELLTGRTPFNPEALMQRGIDEIRRTIRDEEPPRPSNALSTMNADAIRAVAQHRRSDGARLIGLVRGDLDWIVMKALEKDRTRRYETASGLAMDIKRHLAHEPVLATPPSFQYRVQRFVRRNRLAVGAGLAITLAVLMGLAVSIWQAVRAERESARANAMLKALRATAPAFAAQARVLTSQERFDEALEKWNYAAQLQPDSPEPWLAIGDLHQCQFRFAAAANAYRAAIETGAKEERAQHNAQLCERLEAARVANDGKLPRANLAELFDAMKHERRTAAELMPVARLLREESNLALEYWLERLRSLPVSPDRPLESRLAARPDGLLQLDLSETEIVDLSPLAGMPLAELKLASCRAVRSVAPLHDLPLQVLNLASTEIADLAPLRSLRLQDLSVANTRVTDLSPLAGMPLQRLDCSNIAASDFSMLKGMPLEELSLRGTPVRDLKFLAGMPLRKLSLAGASEARQLAALTQLPRIETLILPQNFPEFPAPDIAAIRALAAQPSLQRLTAARADAAGFQAVGARESFARDWEADLRWLHRLHEIGAETRLLLRLPDRTWELDLHNQYLPNLAFLSGAPLSKLVLASVPISDLSPLAGMPLRVLDLRRTEVRDLSALRRMPLQQLYLHRVKVNDFSVLETLPDLELLDVSETELSDLSIIASRKLRELRIGGSKVTDFAPLAGLPLRRLHADGIAVTSVEPLLKCPSLEWIIPPQAARDLARLKALPRLERISFQWREGSEPRETAPEFWKSYEKR